MIPCVELCPDGPKISALVYGTWRILDQPTPPTTAELTARFEACLALGITTLDTAEIYAGYSVESAIGKVFTDQPALRDRMEVITKCGIDIPSDEKVFARLPHYNASAKNLIACAEKSLRLLEVDVLDVFLVHRPDWLTSADETASGLTQLIEQGKIRHAGVSNYTPAQFELLQSRMEKPLVTNQVELSLLAMDALYDGTLAQAEQLRRRPMAWSPLAGSRLFDPEDAAAKRITTCMDGIRAKYHGADNAALAFAWIMAHPSKPIPVIGTNQIERIRSTAEATAIKLERQDWYALWEAAKGHSVP
ncbi:MAG: putative oxidoreductase [Verrucomicrobiales bacterium]|jgi:predicted oxidoreductase